MKEDRYLCLRNLLRNIKKAFFYRTIGPHGPAHSSLYANLFPV